MLFPNLANQIGSSLIKRHCFEHDIGRITILQLLSRNKQVTRRHVYSNYPKIGTGRHGNSIFSGKTEKPVNYAIKINLIAESQFIFISNFEELGKNKDKM